MRIHLGDALCRFVQAEVLTAGGVLDPMFERSNQAKMDRPRHLPGDESAAQSDDHRVPVFGQCANRRDDALVVRSSANPGA